MGRKVVRFERRNGEYVSPIIEDRGGIPGLAPHPRFNEFDHGLPVDQNRAEVGEIVVIG